MKKRRRPLAPTAETSTGNDCAIRMTEISRRMLMAGSAASTAAWMLAPAVAIAQDSGVTESAKAAHDAVQAVRGTILRISREVWNHPELSLHEENSSAIHLRELRQAGFNIVSTGTSGIPTALVAE
jgi:aminobenzoyl-glutamate utilization protein B